MYHRSRHFQFSISFEESKELGTEVNWAEGLKDKLVRSGVSLFGKDVKKKKKRKQLVLIAPSKEGVTGWE